MGNENKYPHGPAESYDIPKYDFSDKVALVTGASQGIGRHTAFGLARCGAKVVLASRSDGGQETAEMIAKDAKSQEAGGEGYFVRCDISKEEEVKAAIDKACDKYGALHFAINNAGHSGENGLIEDQTAENFDSVFNVNVRGSLFCLKHEIKAMRKNEPSKKRAKAVEADTEHGATKQRSGYGKIVNVGSAASFISFPQAGIYVASKHALLGLTQNAAVELAADTDIRVNMVVPGSVKTHNYELFSEGKNEMKKGMIKNHPTNQILMPEDCVPAILFLCSEGAFFSVGQPLMIDGGFTTV